MLKKYGVCYGSDNKNFDNRVEESDPRLLSLLFSYHVEGVIIFIETVDINTSKQKQPFTGVP